MVAELEGGGGGGEEKYEKTRARHGDAVFLRFMKKISLCPQQILRYCRGGCPLFISEPPCNVAQMVSACDACGASRTFELQLMPALVSLLQTRGGSGGQVEFGTVLVYTCRNSCWTAGSKSALEEECLVQCDPDHDLFRWKAAPLKTWCVLIRNWWPVEILFKLQKNWTHISFVKISLTS